MILEVDIGNSRIKWRLRSATDIVMSSVSDNDGRDLDTVFDFEPYRPTAVRVSAVVSGMQRAFSQWSCHRLGIEPKYARVTRTEAGVSNGYQLPSQMGVDRWLAMLAAFQLVKGPCIVVDCGTACTVDVIAENGQHRGGYIVPGLNMMSAALAGGADGVKASMMDYVIPPIPGKSTDEAVSAGLSAMIIGLIEHTVRNSSFDKGGVSLVLTGGDGKKFQQVLTNQWGNKVIFKADLVLDGLQYARFARKSALFE